MTNTSTPLRFVLPDSVSAQQVRTIALSKEVNLRYFDNGDVGMSIDETTDVSAANVLLSSLPLPQEKTTPKWMIFPRKQYY